MERQAGRLGENTRREMGWGKKEEYKMERQRERGWKDKEGDRVEIQRERRWKDKEDGESRMEGGSVGEIDGYG